MRIITQQETNGTSNDINVTCSYVWESNKNCISKTEK